MCSPQGASKYQRGTSAKMKTVSPTTGLKRVGFKCTVTVFPLRRRAGGTGAVEKRRYERRELGLDRAVQWVNVKRDSYSEVGGLTKIVFRLVWGGRRGFRCAVGSCVSSFQECSSTASRNGRIFKPVFVFTLPSNQMEPCKNFYRRKMGG